MIDGSVLLRKGVAVVTGGARGIGLAIAHDLAGVGYQVVLGGPDVESCRAAAREVGQDCLGWRLDVTETQGIERFVEAVEAEVGPIEVWVNNAGVMPTGPAEQVAPVLADLTIDVNFRALVHTCRIVVPRMRSRGRGCLVNVASATALIPLADLAVYSGTKAAVTAFSDALRRELRGSGVQVVVIHPHHTTTAMGAGLARIPVLRPIAPKKVSAAVLVALRHGRPEASVPGWLGPAARLLALFPWRVRDRIVTLLRVHEIATHADPVARRAYTDTLLRSRGGPITKGRQEDGRGP